MECCSRSAGWFSGVVMECDSKPVAFVQERPTGPKVYSECGTGKALWWVRHVYKIQFAKRLYASCWTPTHCRYPPIWDGENAILRVNDGAGYDELHLPDRYGDVAEKLLRFQYAAAAR
jgi:hypothetical protein